MGCAGLPRWQRSCGSMRCASRAISTSTSGRVPIPANSYARSSPRCRARCCSPRETTIGTARRASTRRWNGRRRSRSFERTRCSRIRWPMASLSGARPIAHPPIPTDFSSGFRLDRGGTSVALFHGSERSGFAHQERGKVPHAPFTAEQVARSGLAHALVGHFHRPVLGPWHTYPGNPEPLTIRRGRSARRGSGEHRRRRSRLPRGSCGAREPVA